jgi:alkanesulfonate monooxygenase SsuD/methylene tetrahydromethanopterin reductase-like flavin-dependent oxidoreductase (luciferase family)
MPVGTPEMVADVIEDWATNADIDGFNIACKHPTLTIDRRLVLLSSVLLI